MLTTPKICNRCKIQKDIEDFPKLSRSKDGRNKVCKMCKNLENKEYRNKDINRFREYRKDHYQRNITKMRAEKKKYCDLHKEEKSKYDKIYRENNKENIRGYKKNWLNKNRDNPILKIKRNLRRRIHHVLKGELKSDNAFNLIGCNAEFFKKHIESLWTEGMSWNNYSPTGWHIDHKIPCYKFDLSNPEEQKKCFHYTNQRPLWAKDNLSRRRD